MAVINLTINVQYTYNKNYKQFMDLLNPQNTRFKLIAYFSIKKESVIFFT